MNLDQAVAIVLLGVLVYKTIEIGTAYFKLCQATIRKRRFPKEAIALAIRWVRTADWLYEEFYLPLMLYFLAVATALGLLFLTLPMFLPHGTESFRVSVAVSIVTILSSTFIALLNLFIEKYRSVLEGLA